MPHRYPAEVRHQVIELARSGTKVAQLAATFGMSDATIYNWLRQEKITAGVGRVKRGRMPQSLSGLEESPHRIRLQAWSDPGSGRGAVDDLRLLPVKG
jgi:transposase-like protein